MNLEGRGARFGELEGSHGISGLYLLIVKFRVMPVSSLSNQT